MKGTKFKTLAHRVGEFNRKDIMIAKGYEGALWVIKIFYI